MKQFLTITLIGMISLNSSYYRSVSHNILEFSSKSGDYDALLKLPVCVKYHFEKVGNKYEEIRSFKYGSSKPWHIYWDETDNVLFMDGVDLPIECRYIGNKQLMTAQ